MLLTHLRPFLKGIPDGATELLDGMTREEVVDLLSKKDEDAARLQSCIDQLMGG